MPIPSSPSGIPNQVPAQSSALAQAEKTPNPSLGTPFHPIITAPPTTNAPFSLPNLPKSIPINGAMINAQQSQANLIAQQNFAADNVKLDDGTYISKADFDKLSPTDQASLMKLGVSGFNAQQTANQQAFLANSVKLDDGEYVSKASFNALSPSDQASLMSLGISKFNAQQPQSSSGGSSVPIVPVTQATKDQYASLGKQINDLQTVVDQYNATLAGGANSPNREENPTDDPNYNNWYQAGQSDIAKLAQLQQAYTALGSWISAGQEPSDPTKTAISNISAIASSPYVQINPDSSLSLTMSPTYILATGGQNAIAQLGKIGFDPIQLQKDAQSGDPNYLSSMSSMGYGSKLINQGFTQPSINSAISEVQNSQAQIAAINSLKSGGFFNAGMISGVNSKGEVADIGTIKTAFPNLTQEQINGLTATGTPDYSSWAANLPTYYSKIYNSAGGGESGYKAVFKAQTDALAQVNSNVKTQTITLPDGSTRVTELTNIVTLPDGSKNASPVYDFSKIPFDTWLLAGFSGTDYGTNKVGIKNALVPSVNPTFTMKDYLASPSSVAITQSWVATSQFKNNPVDVAVKNLQNMNIPQNIIDYARTISGLKGSDKALYTAIVNEGVDVPVGATSKQLNQIIKDLPENQQADIRVNFTKMVEWTPQKMIQSISYKEGYTPINTGILGNINPIINTVANWDGMTIAGKAISILSDTIQLVSYGDIVFAVGKGYVNVMGYTDENGSIFNTIGNKIGKVASSIDDTIYNLQNGKITQIIAPNDTEIKFMNKVGEANAQQITSAISNPDVTGWKTVIGQTANGESYVYSVRQPEGVGQDAIGEIGEAQVNNAITGQDANGWRTTVGTTEGGKPYVYSEKMVESVGQESISPIAQMQINKELGISQFAPIEFPDGSTISFDTPNAEADWKAILGTSSGGKPYVYYVPKDYEANLTISRVTEDLEPPPWGGGSDKPENLGAMTPEQRARLSGQNYNARNLVATQKIESFDMKVPQEVPNSVGEEFETRTRTTEVEPPNRSVAKEVEGSAGRNDNEPLYDASKSSGLAVESRLGINDVPIGTIDNPIGTLPLTLLSSIAFVEYQKYLSIGLNKQTAQLATQLVVANVVNSGQYLTQPTLNTQLKLTATQQNAVQQAVSVGIQNATSQQTQIKTAQLTQLQQQIQQQIQSQIAMQQQTKISTQVQTQVGTQTQIATQTATKTATQTGTSKNIDVKSDVIRSITNKNSVPPPDNEPPPPKDEDKYPFIPTGSNSHPIEYADVKPKAGSLVWRQGMFWKYLPPPYKDIQTFKKPPIGVSNPAISGVGSSYKSLEIIGGAPKFKRKVIDLGWSNVLITVRGGKPEIEYLQGADANTGANAIRLQKERQKEAKQAEKNDIIIYPEEYEEAEGRPIRITRTPRKHKASSNEFIMGVKL